MERAESTHRAEKAMSAPGPLLLLRVDVSRAHGTGHLMRCKALGDAWRQAGGRAEYVTASDLSPYAAWLGGASAHQLQEEPGTVGDARATAALAASLGAAWVAADGYHFDAAWQRAFGRATPLLLFDDCGHGAPHSAAVVLNQNPGASDALYAGRDAGTRLLLGPRYAVLRDQFTPWRNWRRETAPELRRLLVTFGGTDPAGMTLRAVDALRELPCGAEIVVGAGNPQAAEIEALCAGSPCAVRRNVLDMPELMAACDAALCAAGSTTLEAAFMQLPQLLVTVADNQLRLADALAASGAAELLGWHIEVSGTQIAQAVHALSDPSRRAAMSAEAARLVDGWGAERVVAHLRTRELRLRPAEPSDDRMLWEWANDPATRAASFDSGVIPWATHEQWFRERLRDPDARLFIATEADAIGLVRFQCAGEEAVISVVMAPESRGRGLAAPLILLGSDTLFRETDVRLIHAYIRPGNRGSRGAFQRAGFRHVGQAEVRGEQAEHFTLERL
jgi:UDP-2,4-diacetamido-2,4,6-trideoxy-beta-L-altropyranose hydrolase